MFVGVAGFKSSWGTSVIECFIWCAARQVYEDTWTLRRGEPLAQEAVIACDPDAERKLRYGDIAENFLCWAFIEEGFWGPVKPPSQWARWGEPDDGITIRGMLKTAGLTLSQAAL